MVSHVIMWDIMAVNGIIHALASPLLTPPQSVSMEKGETRPQKVKKQTSLASSLALPFSLQRAVLGSEPQPVALSLGVVVTSGTLLGLVAGALYLRARGKPRGFSFSVFQVKSGWGRRVGGWLALLSCLGAGLTNQHSSSRQKIMQMMTSPHGKKGPAQPWFLSPTLFLAAVTSFVNPLM